ncbi:protein decapping 5-like isoform X2 [Miscanthus floridulus]|uniref:protein decapping 5-like isoform X2 n=1 Tax=Miscanthus floridulus TaxID=154761 RepID=UPI0034598C96
MAAEAPPSASSSSSSAQRPPAAAAPGSGGGAAGSAESYIGSLISLTSKSEIRYEGVLYNINTEESSIGLRNVRSFGTEGRKKDGMQIPASDKVYEYILFRGTDIKDLQVKSSPPQAASLHNDPAIIQSHYSQPASTSSSLPSAGGAVLPDLSSQAVQYGLQRPTFQSNLPLYQPGNAPWGSSVAPPAGNASTLSVPSMYWQGYYAPSSGLPPHLQQPPLLQPTPGLSVPQNLQYLGLNPSLPSGPQKLSELQPSLMPAITSQGPSTGILPATTAPASATLLAPESSKPLLPNMVSLFTTPATSLGATFPFPSQPTSMAETSATVSQNLTSFGSNKATALPGSTLAYQTISQSVSSTIAPSSSAQVEMPVPLLAPSGQLLQNTSYVLSSSNPMQAPLQVGSKEVKPVEPKAKVAEPLLPDPSLPDPPSRALPENKEPILPLPKQTPQKFSQSVTSFTEEFDFTAMNEKFNKDEVWGHLGKKSQSRDKDGEVGDDVFDEDLEVEETDNPELAVKPVYVKDDFFDSLSSGTFGRGGPNGRGRPSERRRVDTETFGEFPRHRQPYRGGARGYRGGGRSRGSYYGGRGYGNTGTGGYGNTGTGGYGNTGTGGPGNSYPHRGYGRD